MLVGACAAARAQLRPDSSSCGSNAIFAAPFSTIFSAPILQKGTPGQVAFYLIIQIGRQFPVASEPMALQQAGG